MTAHARNLPAAPASRRLLPVVLTAGALVAAAIGAYFIARQTGILALDRIQVDGASPAVAKQVRRALKPYVGTSLVRFDAGAAAKRLAGVAEIADFRFDRDFPHTLKVHVRLGRPAAVLRRGSDAWLVSSSARVLQKLDRRPYPRLPRIWVPRSAGITLDSTLGGPGAKGVAALAPLRSLRFGVPVRQVLVGDGELTLLLGSGAELRLGDSGDLRLKLSIAKQLLPLTSGARYVDVSVPERPVAAYKPQVGG